jgi:hypothetical protein
MARLARETGLSRRWIVKLTKLVERRGHWRVTRTRVGPKNIANRYHLTCTTVHHPSELASFELSVGCPSGFDRGS